VIFITTIVVFVSPFAEDFDNEDAVDITTTTNTGTTITSNTNDSNDYNNDDQNNNDNNNYAVRAYECDSNNIELLGIDRVEKIIGNTIRICFVPTEETMMDGIGIEKIDSFNWSHGKLVSKAVIDGTTDGILNAITCSNSSGQDDEDGSDDSNVYDVCVLQSMLGSEFYVGTGSIEGDGILTLTDEARTIVAVKRDVFHTSDQNFGQESGQCITDTDALLSSFPELEEATTKYQAMEYQKPGSPGSIIITSSSGLSGSVEEVIVGSIISISVPDGDEKNNYYNTCMDAGGIVTELPDTVVECNLYGQITNMEMTNSISCLADTDECYDLNVTQILIEAYALAGIICGPAPPSSSSSSPPPPPLPSPSPSRLSQVVVVSLLLILLQQVLLVLTILIRQHQLQQQQLWLLLMMLLFFMMMFIRIFLMMIFMLLLLIRQQQRQQFQ